MSLVRVCDLPSEALLRKYHDGGGYADCYAVDMARPVSQAEYVEAFYTTAVFKVERSILAWFASRPSTDGQAKALATGTSDAFAAWTVEGRKPDQLLLADFQGRTRSWLMSVPVAGGGATRLYFGSAVVPVASRKTGQAKMGFAFRALLGFHKLYSRVLLRAAVSRLESSGTMI